MPFIQRVNQENYQDYTDKLWTLYRFADIPNQYLNNHTDPFKPFFNYIPAYGIGRVYEYATIFLHNFTIAEIKEIRSFLSNAVIDFALNQVTIVKQQYESTYSIRDYAKLRPLLLSYLNANDTNKTYRTSTDKEIDTVHLYAVMSIKFIKQALKILDYKSTDPLFFPFFNKKKSTIDYDMLSKLLIFATESLYIGQLISSNTYQNQLKKQKLENLSIRLSKIEETKAIAISKSKAYWENDDPYKIIRINAMTQIVLADLKSLADSGDDIFIPSKETLKEWIKPTAPDYTKQNGRPSEKEKEQLKLFVKERFDVNI